jgi:phage baseplate assembly protein gpV
MIELKFGTIETININEHKATIRELDTNLIGPELPIIATGANTGKSFNVPAIGEVACALMFGDFVGVIIGTYYTASKKPTNPNKNEYIVLQVSSDMYIKFDTSTGNYEVKTTGSISMNSANVLLGQSPTSKAMLYDAFNTWVTDPVSGLEAWLKTGLAPAGGGFVTYANPIPSPAPIEAQQVKVK